MAINPLHHLGLVGGPIGLEECPEHAVPNSRGQPVPGQPWACPQPAPELPELLWLHQRAVGELRHLWGEVAASFFFFLFPPFNFHLGHCFRAKGCFRLHPAHPCSAAAPGNSPRPSIHSPKIPLQKAMMWLQRSSPTVPSSKIFRTTKTNFFFLCLHPFFTQISKSNQET